MVVQDETGVYVAGTNGVIVLRNGVSHTWVNFSDWLEPRKVTTTSEEYLAFIREFERSSYMITLPTELRELPGTTKEVALAVFERGI